MGKYVKRIIVSRFFRLLLLLVLILVFVMIGHRNVNIRQHYRCPSLSFSKTPLPRTALASYPGSGNTWARHLIQKMTGIATGHLFAESALLRGGFPGEGRKDGSVAVIKTHFSYTDTRYNATSFKRAILLIRNPYEALLAEFRRSVTGNHTGYPTIGRFKNWDDHFNREIERYRTFYISWLQHKDLYPLFYDDLKRDLPNALLGLLSFLKKAHIDGNIVCALEDSEGNFHRKHSTHINLNFFYSKEKINVTNNVILELNDKFWDRFRSTSYDMKKWLMK